MSKRAIKVFKEVGSQLVEKLGEAVKVQKALKAEGIDTALIWHAHGKIEVRAA